MKDATRRISALLLAIVMLLTMMPVSVLGESTEEIYEPDVIFEPEYIEPGIEEEPDEEQPVITEPNKEPKEYENEGVIDPSTVSFADVEKAFAENGHAYVVSNIDVDVYADTEQTQHLCTVVKSGTIYYADKKNGSVLHVWFALANGTVMNGYISASVLDGTVIEDSNAQDLAAIGSVNAVINDASVLVFVTETADATVQEENIEITPAIEEEIVEEMILPEAAEESTEPATEELEQEIAPAVEEEIVEEVILPEDAEETTEFVAEEPEQETVPAVEEGIVEEVILPEDAEETTELVAEEPEQETVPAVEEEIVEEVILPEDAEESSESVVEDPEQEIVPANEDETTVPETEIVPVEEVIEIAPVVEEEVTEEIIIPEAEEKTVTEEIVIPAEETNGFDMEEQEEAPAAEIEESEQGIIPVDEDETTAPETEIVPAEDLIEITPAVEDEINEEVISHETEEKTITEEIVAPAEETICFDMEEQEEVPTAEAEEPEPIPNVEEEPVLPSPTEEDKEEIEPDEGTIGEVKNEEQQLDEISVEEIAPAIEEPEVNTAIAPASNVEIVVTSGSVPEKATASMIAYSHSQSQKLVDKWIFGIEEKPKLMMTSKKMMAASSVNIVPEIELEEEEYAEGVIVEEIPGPVQTGTHTAYAAFNVSILVDGEEYTEDGDFNVTIKPENIRLMDGIRNDATVTNVSYKMYHIHDGLEEIVINDNDVVIGEDGKVEAISFETNNFSDYIFSYTVDFYFVDPITQITTPACSIGGGDSILLSELLKCFNIDESLYGSVVEFTDPTLIQMEPVADANGNIIDWELLSLLPFQTDEILTVTLNDGTILKINVKDDQHVAAKDVFSSWAVSLLGRVQMYGNPELNVVQVTESIRVPQNVNVTKRTFEGSQSLPSGTYTIEALVRYANLHFYVINTKHLVGSAGWDDDYAILDCYGGTALTNVVPAKRTVYFETGAENAGKQVQLIDYKGKVLETVTADKNGKATFGKYYWYEPEKAIAFELANLTREEWVKNNDCATFQSQALIAGGIAMYNPYTGGDKFLGTSDIDGMIQKFIKWRDSQAPGITIQGCFQTKATIGDFHKGDIIWCENGTMGHVMGVASNSGLEVELTAHSTSAKHVDYTDHCYIKNFDGIDYIVHLEPLTYTYKVAPTNGKVEVTKTNEKGTAMANVKFTLVGTNYSVEKTTNTSGIATWTDVPAGTYTLKETTVPAGYIKASDETIIVKPDETTKKTITNKPIMGKIKLKKTDASTGAALANAVFEVKNSSGTVVDTITTIADGTGTSKDLPYGTYTITEKTPPTGYKKWTDSKTVTISSHGQTVDVGTITNTMITGTVVVTKYRKKMYDGMQEKTLQGATLELRKAGTTTVVGAAKGTDANGQVMWTNIPFGTYDIYETKAPTGYQLGGKVGTVTVNSESITTYKPNVTNTPVYGSVEVKKKDDTGAPLKGATFELLDSTKTAKAKYINGTTTENKSTDASGSTQWQNLEYGEYYVHEVTAPTGYQLDKGYYKVVVDKQDGTGTTGTATVTDKKIQGKIRITKTDDLTDEPIPHAKFHITCTDGFDKGNVNLDIETNAQGIAETDLLNFGTYHIVETEAPDEYCTPNYSNDVKVEKDNQGQILYTDVGVKNTAKKGKLSVEKKDALDGSAMANVQFDIYRYSNGTDIYTAKGDLTLVSSMTTGTDGKGVSGDLQKGLYVVKEHANPTGYQDTIFVSGDLKVEPNKTTPVSTTAVTNQPIQGKLQIIKKDELTQEAMADVTFTVTQTAGIPSKNGADIRKPFTIVTDKDGVAVTELLTYGTYVVTETVPTHYIDQNFKWTVDIHTDDVKEAQVYKKDVANKPAPGKLSVEKKDALDGSVMANVQFDIYRYSNGTDIYTAKGDLTLVSSMTTGTDGKAVSGDLQKGLYVVKEHAVLTGYQDVLFTSDDLKVESDKTTPVSTEAVTNQPIQGKIKLVKTDEVTKEVMPDVTFTVTQTAGIPSKNGADIRKPFTIVTDKDGVAVTELLTYGTYVVTETVPTHYIDQNFKWTVDIHTDDKTDEQTYTKDVVNKPAPGWIKVVKKDALNDNFIEGVQFDVYRYKGGATIWEKTTDKELVTTITTAKNGIGITEDLVKGCYYVVEHGKTAGYLFETVEFDEVIVKSDETTSLEAENKPVQVNITIYKRDENEYKGEIPTSSPDAAPVKANIEVPKTRGDATLEGAVFDLIAAEDVLDRQGNVVYKAGAVVETLTVGGAEASAVSKNVFPGVYKFVEKTAPEGYKPSTEEIMVDTSWAAKQSDIEVVAYEALKLNEVQTGKLRIVKIYGDNEIHTESGVLENAEEGAAFQVYRTDAGSYSAARDDERDLLTTDKYGMATTKLLPYGEYTVKQLTGKEGYALKADFTVKLSGEFETEPLQKNINNQALKYYLQIIKIDEETGKTITMSGVKFKLKDSNGNYVQQTLHYPRETKIDTFETDESGTVTLPETVLYGTYHVCEFSAPEGYLITTEEVEVKVGNAEDKAGQIYTVKVNVEDKPVKGNIFINKKGLQLVGFEEMTENGQTVNKPIFEDKYLEGAVFEIYAREDIIGKDGTVWYTKDEMVDTITTTAAGNDKSKDLPLGKYYVIEVSAPDGYVFADKEYDVELKYEDDKTAYVKAILDVGNDYLKAEISAIKVKEVNMPDEQADGQVKQKIEIVPGEGFTYGLYNAEEISCAAESLPADSLVSAKVTDADGKIVFSGTLPHGEYYVKEIKAADGWLTDDTRHPISVDPLLKAENEPIIRVSSPEKFQNKEKVYPVTITKTDITGEETIPGALIEITNEKGEVVYRAYTDENGEIPDIRLKPGKYEFREILAPEGYALNVAVMTFTLDEDGNVTGDTTIRDDYTRVKLSKHDTDGKLLPGVEFTMYDKDHKVFTTAVTDKDGIATFEKMPYGTFTVEETKTLEGYIPKTGALVAVVVDGTFVNPDGVIGDIINEPNEVKVKKVDQDGNVMANVKFGLYKDGKQITTATTDKNGIATFSKLPYGIYTIKEAEAIEGYLLCKTELKVTIDANYRNSTEVLGTFVNHLKRIKYIKTDTSGKYLEGVEFDLIDKATGKTVETVSSDANGVFTFTKFDYGDWIIREVTAPAGFNKMNDIELHVGDDWTEPAPFTCVNIPNHYEFVKTDNKGNPLPGVRFTLEDADGNILGDYVSDEDGIVRVTDLTPGKYVIREIETLEGFILSGDAIIVEINEKYVVPEEMYTLVNYPEPKTGVILDNPFAWVGFAVIGIALVAGWWFLIHKKYSVNHK